MTCHQFKILTLISLLVVVLATYIIHVQDPWKRLEADIENYRIDGCFDYVTSGTKGATELYYDNCVRLLNERYRKNVKGININGPIKPNHVNIYFLAKDPKGLFHKFQDNCAYIGYKNIIICDITFVRKLQRPILKFPTTSTDDSLVEKIAQAWQENVVLWIVGHEIGHLAYDHCDRHFTFNDEGDEHFIKVFDEKYSNAEDEADGFAVLAAGRAVDALYFGFAQFINQMGSLLLLEQGHSFPFTESREKIIVKAESNTHPPLFLRAVNIMLDLCRIYGVESPPEYYESIRNRIEIVR